jgi:hypothetical protein
MSLDAVADTVAVALLIPPPTLEEPSFLAIAGGSGASSLARHHGAQLPCRRVVEPRRPWRVLRLRSRLDLPSGTLGLE